MMVPPRLLHFSWFTLGCGIGTRCFLLGLGHPFFSLLLLPMAPKQGGGASGRGHGRRGRGGHTPRSSRGGRCGAAVLPSSSCADEDVWRYDFLLRILSRTSTRIPLSFLFASMIS